MKRIKIVFFALFLTFTVISFVSCEIKAPQKLEFRSAKYLLSDPGSVLDLSGELYVTGDKRAKIVYAVSDESVATVSPDGTLIAVGSGTAEITAVAADDENVRASAEIMVYPYAGAFVAEKYVDTLGCEVRARIVLDPQGSYVFYRYPMDPEKNGGVITPSFTDSGWYRVENGRFFFTGDVLGDFDMTFSARDGRICLDGTVALGVARAKLTMELFRFSDRGEFGVYAGEGQSESGAAVDCQLYLENGSYKLLVKSKSGQDTVSSGIYAFNGDVIEFVASRGPSFYAEYSSAVAVVRSDGFPISINDGTLIVSGVLKKS